MRRCRATLIFSVFAGLATPVEGRDDPVVLRVKPVLCITDARAPQCEMSLIVDWRSTLAGDYCLYNDFSADEPLGCWQAQAAGRHVEDRVVDETFSYWLTRGDADGRLAEAQVEVMSADSSDRRRNRRSRHVWSIL